ncbi:MAG: hypothetical protein SVR94_03050 [Pseudomonadota bacterium]|nr:hypothetical protein [Pseudomonadota bacterium]
MNTSSELYGGGYVWTGANPEVQKLGGYVWTGANLEVQELGGAIFQH